MPDLVQRVLQDGQLVDPFGQVMDEPFREPAGDPVAAQYGRFLDHLLELGPVQAWYKKLGESDVFWQAPERRALPDEVGTHGEHHIDRQIFVVGDAGRFQQQVQHQVGLGGRRPVMVVLRIGEKFLKLIHKDHQVAGLAQILFFLRLAGLLPLL